MQSQTDLFIFAGIIITAITWMYIVGRVDQAKIEMKKRRAAARRGPNNLARLQARMVSSSKVIRKG